MSVDINQVILALIAQIPAILAIFSQHKQSRALADSVPKETACDLGRTVPGDIAGAMAVALANSVPARLPQAD